jgi:hypothetical protein
VKASTPNEPLTETESTASGKFLMRTLEGNRTPHSPIQTRNHKKRAVGLSQQISRDAEPFRIQWLPAYGLACSTVPVRSVALIAFFAMQVRVYPRTLLAFVLLGRFVSPLPIPLGIPP